MLGKPLRLVCVGRIKTGWWKDAAGEYAKRIARFRKLAVAEVRDADPSLEPAKRSALEGVRILKELGPQDLVLAMDERGEEFTSEGFARFLEKLDREAQGTPCFVIGGPFGLADEVRRHARRLVRLGRMTLPHELARVVLLEQIYRAECIRRSIPYHH
ncbi:MAG: 23S rRNA (pseudouridine(1915)-N(3))-methyltransferase RlmH [Desulfovibrio sp.]|jgi:23S rRNA (pseudouridine1915-N3)-methyltransferase|nr:23S rRNA (pseudouridine(1915)-N(3))-methyltransferase RlmH [Desulfovibrio sp.]MBQ1845009.1 23S rRNA (pseudouridine(1915)-N(3))-methyltransferase RlmH [Desulfovibrio sp.]MCR5171152.1 23S rRNA (pseudouridine(1915)-N(3))-methyltransferase RlmH [Desulfovibrio sp.]